MAALLAIHSNKRPVHHLSSKIVELERGYLSFLMHKGETISSVHLVFSAKKVADSVRKYFQSGSCPVYFLPDCDESLEARSWCTTLTKEFCQGKASHLAAVDSLLKQIESKVETGPALNVEISLVTLPTGDNLNWQ
jgi:hypothetical protein